ncbi:MAG: 4Fe-4S binding protein [Phycisphaerae bacterium]
MKLARVFLVFSYGLFIIGVQTLLFREFITALEGNDISVGLFFFSWFLWVAIGAFFISKNTRLAEAILSKIHWFLLLYLPAVVIQFLLILYARELAGIKIYELPAVEITVLLAVLVNAPFSLLTGIFFPLACKWLSMQSKMPVSRVYILEAAGSFAGGLAVTILLAAGLSAVRVFVLLAFFLSIAAFFVEASNIFFSKTKFTAYLKIAVLVFLSCAFPVFILLQADRTLVQEIQKTKWSKLLPSEAFEGSFQTAQAEYLYGFYQGQFVVVSQGSTVEVLGDRTIYGKIAATALCQKPNAQNILVLGTGLGLCQEFLHLEQIRKVSWVQSDEQYSAELKKVIPENLRIADSRFHIIDGDIRRHLAEGSEKYDIVITNLPDATSSVLNRYYTLEFYQQLKTSLAESGVLAVSFTGGENVMGAELINLGASIKNTLSEVFGNLVLVPGDQSWFIASDSSKITDQPGVLKDRFSQIKGASELLVPDGLFTIYRPERAAKALELYEQSDLPENLLINTDSRALANLYSLLLMTRQSGAPVTKFFKNLAQTGPVLLIAVLLIFVLLRIFYILGSPKQGLHNSFQSSFLVFSAGLAAIGSVIALMYLYQTYFGSLYLHIGIISSLFMIGLTAGAFLTSALAQKIRRITPLVLASVLIHILILFAIILWPDSQKTQVFFTAAFFICGLCSGFYFPFASRFLNDAGIDTIQAGSKLEISDHLGASVGGILSSLLIIPVFGIAWTLLFMILILAVNIPLILLEKIKFKEIYYEESLLYRCRRAGYVLFGIAAAVVISSHLIGYPSQDRVISSTPQTAEQLQQEKIAIGPGDAPREITYTKVFDKNNNISGYIFDSFDFTPQISGFGGPIQLLIRVDNAGVLQDFQIVKSNETESYLAMLSDWFKTLKGQNLFANDSIEEVHTVTGATDSSKAIINILHKSGELFYQQVIQQIEPAEKSSIISDRFAFDIHTLYFASAIILTLLTIYFGGFKSRLFVLIFNLIIAGMILNMQYSSEQMINLLTLRFSAFRFSGSMLLTFTVPVLIVLFGNIYCGYLCPFGAAQELLSYIIPAKFKRDISINSMQRGRFVKYIVLFVFVIAFFISGNRKTVSADPLITVFSSQITDIVMVLVLLIAVGSLFYIRFWCRYLCPVGAFLSLFNSLRLFKKLNPAKHFKNCEFGLSLQDQADCIYCDRCRYKGFNFTPVSDGDSQQNITAKFLSIFLPIAAIIIALFISIAALKPLGNMVQPSRAAVVSEMPSGSVRDIDAEKINELIRQGKLSDEQALFYKKAE